MQKNTMQKDMQKRLQELLSKLSKEELEIILTYYRTKYYNDRRTCNSRTLKK